MTTLSIKETLPRITNPRVITGIRVIWVLLTVAGLIMTMLSLPFFVQDCGCPPDVVSGWEQLGIATIVRIVFTTWAAIDSIFFFALAGYLVWQRPDEIVALLTALFFTVGAGDFFTSPLAIEALPLVNTLYIFFTGLSVMFVPLWIHVFPRGRFLFPWIKWVFVGLSVLGIISIFVPILQGVYIGIGIVIGVLGIIGQVYRYMHTPDKAERQQIKWLLFALVAMAIYMTLGIGADVLSRTPVTRAIVHAIINNISYAAFMGMGLAVVFAIIRFRLWDVDLVINRSIVYGSFAVMAIVLFFAVLTGLQITFGRTQPLLATLVAGGFAAAVFQPTRRRLQSLVDRHIYGFRFDQNQLLKQPKPITKPGLLTGAIIEGYEVGGVLGQGGMGEVYLAQSPEHTVAIKTIQQKWASHDVVMARFDREVAINHQLDHPHIAKSYESGVYEGTPFIVMEYVEGQTLSALIAEKAPLDVPTTFAIMADICEALSLAHAHDLVHRDLKPSNIIVRDSGEAVLVDFGIAKLSQASRELTGSDVIGTIDYMAPEQIKATADVDQRADIYALGVLTYQMLSGTTPFEGTLAQVMFAHLQRPAPDIREQVASIPAHIANAIMRAMAKDPDDRYQSASAFMEALNEQT